MTPSDLYISSAIILLVTIAPLFILVIYFFRRNNSAREKEFYVLAIFMVGIASNILLSYLLLNQVKELISPTMEMIEIVIWYPVLPLVLSLASGIFVIFLGRDRASTE